jgi:polyhydroxyalkanoate synthesis regulator phasin
MLLIFTTQCVIEGDYPMATKTRNDKEQEQVIIPSETIKAHHSLFNTARKVLLAGIGVMALAQDEVEDFVNRLIERGEIAEKDGRKLIQEIQDKRKENSVKAEEKINSHIEKVLSRMNIASRSDIETMSQKISDLSKKLDELSKGN